MDDVQNLFVTRLADLGIVLSAPDKQLAQLETYYQLLIEWNEKMNLTGITERDAVYEKHFYDSLTLSHAVDLRSLTSIADIGSGAGFPSMPIKIVFPHLRITIVDALAKRIKFLEAVTSALEMSEVSCLHARAEEAGRMPEHRDRYDLVTARAVAKLAALNELCLPFARTGGTFIAMKGSDVETELEESRYSVRQLNASISDNIRLTLPGEGSVRHLVVISKKGATPNVYPRKPGVPLKQPLL
jgi:16S rRNA (guanine527-N7)-methyltransferase